MRQPDDATLAQIGAADPRGSAWVSANAGSGKTKVLTDRVARLLLAGTRPQHILCLTYTKAAAAEMQNRLFQRLGEWAMLDDARLSARLVELGEAAPDAATLRIARTLFARALEAPGGLKIQTIHSFCAALLRRFPLEAGVSPGFTEMEERAARRLCLDIIETLALDEPETFAAVAAHVGEEALEKLTGEILRHRAALARPADPAEIWRSFGLSEGVSETALGAEVLGPGGAGLQSRLIPVLATGSTTDAKAAAILAQFDPACPDLTLLEQVCLYGEKAKVPFGAKIDAFPTKATRAKLGADLDALNALMTRIEAARPRRQALAAARKTLALHRFAAPFLAEYDRRKLIAGWLDFDDLILKARALLSVSTVAQWVLYRLDGGIDHILVDEAQDTSPEQWDVIWRLAEEFTAGEGARQVERTVFVVGDEKQSIYSFQGADPAAFGRMRERFRAHLAGIGKPLLAQDLLFSFRSAETVLRTVDMTFLGDAGQGVAASVTHRAFKAAMPGRVDLWPFIEKDGTRDEHPWTDPVDLPSPNDPPIVLARRIADAVRTMLDTGERLALEGREGLEVRPVAAGDVLILVQRRSVLFHEIIRALKAAGLPVAGADRLKIGGELAVKDLTAALAFLATPEDDLSLAAVLRSPLCGLSEGELFRLAHPRRGYLWAELRGRAAEFPAAHALLSDLRDTADYLRPYEMLERILTRHRGRERLIARLGPEAEDGIDAMLAQALAYERAEPPGLTGFLGWLAADEVEIKRQLDTAGDRIRVMTVHGAKGLEAPIVILPDTAERQVRLRQQVLVLDDGTPAWNMPAADCPPPLSGAQEFQRALERAERLRLLYVAMTRAESWLIVCGGGTMSDGPECWYATVARGLEGAGAVAHDFVWGTGLRAQSGAWPAPQPGAAPAVAASAPALPDWSTTAASIPPAAAEVLSPSDLGGAKVLAAEAGPGMLDEEAAKRRGTDIHRLLEVLPLHPEADWPALAATLLAEDAAGTLAEVAPLLRDPALAHLFGGESVLAEVPVTAALDELGGQRILGRIDRLLIAPDRVLAVDFKSNVLVPDRPESVPEGLLRQMGAYAAALAQIYPGRSVETAILWTATGQLMHLPHDMVRAALRLTPRP